MSSCLVLLLLLLLSLSSRLGKDPFCDEDNVVIIRSRNSSSCAHSLARDKSASQYRDIPQQRPEISLCRRGFESRVCNQEKRAVGIL